MIQIYCFLPVIIAEHIYSWS